MDKKKEIRSFGLSFIVALGVQILLLLLLMLVVVITPVTREKPDPEWVPVGPMQPTAKDLPPPSIHHDLASAMHPAGYDRIQAAVLGDFSLPEFKASDTAAPSLSLESAELIGALDNVLREGLDGIDALDTLNQGVDFSFLGLNERAERVVILFDISLSTVNDIEAAGSSIQVIRDETLRLIDGLDGSILFGLLQFSRNHQWFDLQLQPATQPNRQRACEWVVTEFRTDGLAGRGWTRGRPYNGIQAVLAEAFDRDPEVVFIVSNGRFYRSPGNERVPWNELERQLRQLQRQRVQPVRIHFIGYGVREEVRSALRQLLRPWPGSLTLH